MMGSSVYTLAGLGQEVQSNPEHWRPLVFTNGCFDLLHAGHIRYLQAAKQLGKALIVGLNSDRSVAAIKPTVSGEPPRPIIPELQRAEILSALRVVDGVVLFQEHNACRLLRILKPEVYVKGADYRHKGLPEAVIAHSYGGAVHFIQIEVPSSTTKIIQKIITSRV